MTPLLSALNGFQIFSLPNWATMFIKVNSLFYLHNKTLIKLSKNLEKIIIWPKWKANLQNDMEILYSHLQYFHCVLIINTHCWSGCCCFCSRSDTSGFMGSVISSPPLCVNTVFIMNFLKENAVHTFYLKSTIFC